MSVFKKPYEISLWEDRLTFVDNKLNEYELSVPNDVTVATSYYRERKICTIGADSFDAPIRAINPQLKRNINGSNSLSFSLYAKYYDEGQEKLVDNPFIKYLTNERKVKLKYIEKGEIRWLDFVIKGITENSETYLYSYTAQDAFVNELSKTGFSLVFDEKLNNNTGNVQQLGEKIVEGTDWRIGEETEIIQQKQQEALYRVKLNQDINAYKANDINQESPITLSAGSVIYAFYSCVSNKIEDFFQFLYRQDNQYLTDDKRVITNADEFYLSVQTMDDNGKPDFAESMEYISQYRGERSVRKQKQVFDKILQQYVLVYENNGKEIYGYSEKEYLTSDLIRSYITNPNSFSNVSGWKQNQTQPLELVVFPSFEEKPQFLGNRLSAIKYIQSNENFLFNSGISDNSFYIKELLEGEEYVFRLDCRVYDAESKELLIPNNSFKIQIATYNLDSTGAFVVNENDTLFEGIATQSNDPQKYFKCKMSNRISFNTKQLKDNKIGIFITAMDGAHSAQGEFYIIDAQFYKFAVDENDNECLPNGQIIEYDSNSIPIITDNFKSVIKTNYYYYLPDTRATSKEEIKYIYIGPEKDLYLPKFNSNYEKIRSITASGTNRFDLLQKLAESFECWCRFEVKHKLNGEIMLAKDSIKEVVYDGGTSSTNENVSINAGNSNLDDYPSIDAKNTNIESLFFPQKFITFHKNIGQTSNVDFIYGINLKSIVRTVESNNIVTKLIVKTNNNQFAQQGGCDISRAKENPTSGNVLYNFDQYISQGLLNEDNFYNDLYSLNVSRGWIGFYTRLKQINLKLQDLEKEKRALLASQSELSSQYSNSQLMYEKSTTELRDKEEEFYDYTKYSINTIPTNSKSLQENKIIALGEDILRLRAQAKKSEKEYQLADKELQGLNLKLEKIEKQIKVAQEQKSSLFNTFENKYSRFIQEGPWNSEDYVDDSLYYLDAESTLYNSAQPKVQYNINILEISALEGYEDFAYALGDITHIQDTEFFGWHLVNGQKTPYREKIVVTETTTNFDNPDKDAIKMQNYRTQFEDLFQRMAAVTQRVEFYSGAYEKAAGTVMPNGQITPEALTDAFANNTETLKNANNQSVSWDDKGITTTSSSNSAEIVRIVSGGIFISNDGGNTWTTGITGNGINAKTITTGQLNTELITILNGNQPAFRWDASGISAYKQEEDGRYNNQTYVRFDQFGLYGMKNGENSPLSLETVWDQAQFSLTWKGFKLRTGREGEGAITIDTENDFVVFDRDSEKIIQIGRIGNTISEDIDYGIVIRDPSLSTGLSTENALEDKVVFKASKDGLFIGGWKISKNAFVSPDLSGDGKPEIAIYSEPLEENVDLTDADVAWRILARDQGAQLQSGQTSSVNFGLDTEGNVYCRGMFVQGAALMKSNRLNDAEGRFYEVEISLNGVQVAFFSNETDLEPQETKTLSWAQLVTNF